MRIVDIRECSVALEGNIANAVVNFSKHTVSLVAVVSDQFRNGQPVIGFGFNSIGRFAQSGILRERLMPRVTAAAPDSLLLASAPGFDPAAVARTAMQDEKPGGHGDRAGAVGALELAVWDLNAKLRDEPAYVSIRRSFAEHGARAADNSVEVYAAGGYYYPEDSHTRLRDELADYQQQGYQACKIKIGGASLREDMRRVEVAIQATGAGARVAVDANGRFDLLQAQAYADALADYAVRWYEEPGDPLDYALNSALIAHYGQTVATGENLFSCADAVNLMRFGGMRPGIDIFQMDPGLAYGLGEYARMLQALEQQGYSRRQCFPHGGHLINLHVVVGLGLGGCEAYPGVFQPFGGYAPQCRVTEGRISPSDAPGFGLEQKVELQPHLERLR